MAPPIAFAPAPTLETARMKLRGWRASDLPAFAALNADPQVMRYFPALLSQAESDARAALAYGFGPAGLNQIIAVAPVANGPSLAVMGRLGMGRDPAEDFDHPHLTDYPELRRCALHRLDRADYKRGAAA